MRAMGMEESEKITAHPLRIISGTALRGGATLRVRSTSLSVVWGLAPTGSTGRATGGSQDSKMITFFKFHICAISETRLDELWWAHARYISCVGYVSMFL